MPMRTGSSITRRQFAISSTASAAAFAAAPGAASAPAPRARLRRSESYFGLHFDLHPNENDTVLGRDVSAEMVGSLLDAVRPDYVQYGPGGPVRYELDALMAFRATHRVRVSSKP